MPLICGIVDSPLAYHIVAVLSSHIFRVNTDRKYPINKFIRYENGDRQHPASLGLTQKQLFILGASTPKICEIIFSSIFFNCETVTVSFGRFAEQSELEIMHDYRGHGNHSLTEIKGFAPG